MRFSYAAFAAFLIVGGAPQTALYAQGPPGQPYIQVPIPQIPGITPQSPGNQGYDRDRWEHCERLRDREHELRDRLAYAPRYGEERERLEHQLREVDYQRERCRGR